MPSIVRNSLIWASAAVSTSGSLTIPFINCPLQDPHPAPGSSPRPSSPLLPAASFPSHRLGLVTGVGKTCLRVCPAEKQQGKQDSLSEGALGPGAVSRSMCEFVCESLYVSVSLCVSPCEGLTLNGLLPGFSDPSLFQSIMYTGGDVHNRPQAERCWTLVPGKVPKVQASTQQSSPLWYSWETKRWGRD